MLYKFRYKSPGLKTRFVNILEKYDEDIHKAIYSFFSTIQNEDIASLSILKEVWGSLWIGAKTPKDILYVEPSSWRDTHDARRKRGIKTIVDVYNRFSKNPGYPIVVNQKYEVAINNSISLTGTMEVVREINRRGYKEIELMDFKIDDKMHNKIHVEKDLEITAAAYAFEKMFDTDIDSITYYGLDKNKLHSTYRTKDDYKVMFRTVECVSTAIHNKLFYVCPDDKCYSCPYKSICVSNLNMENML